MAVAIVEGRERYNVETSNGDSPWQQNHFFFGTPNAIKHIII
jgi:hypothetical protein